MDELKYAVRRLQRQAGASAVTVAALACSIGGVAVTWAVLSATLIKPLDVADSDRLMAVGAGSSLAHSIAKSDAFSGTAVHGFWTAVVTTPNDAASRTLSFATPNFFSVLGVPVALGRDFNAVDDEPGRQPVAILSHRFWQTAFQADASVVGQRVEIASHTVEVVGVAPPGFSGVDLTQPVDIFLPLNAAVPIAGNGGRMPPMERRAIGRLRDTDSAAAVEGRLNAAFPDQGGRRFSLIPIQTAAIAEASRPAMKTFARLLSIAVGLLLVIGCLTAGVLLLLRTEARRDDFAMCLALGATRGLLVRGIAIEGAALVGAGSLLSLPLAAGFIAALRNTSLPGGISTAAMNLSGYLIGAAAAGAAAAALVIAFVAVAAGFSTTVQDVLRSRGGSTPRLKGRFARAALIVGQVAVSVVLVAGAGLLARSLAASLKVNPGFETEHLVTSIVGLERYRLTPQAATPYFEQLRDRLAANPAFQSVSVALSAGGMSTAGSLTIDGIERRFPSMVALSVVDERYFSTIGLPILTGRDFSSLDDERTPLVTVVSESLSRMIANGGNPIGSRIKHFHGRQDGSWPALSIVGVVPDVITNVGQLQPLAMYTPVAQSIEPPGWWRRVFVRPRGDVKAAERELATVARQLDPSIRPAPTVTMQTMAEQIGKQMAPQRIAALILGALGGIALLLTALGTYVLAESMAVVQRREMGIRAALGASRSQLTGIVLTEAGRFVGIGLALGLLLAWAQAASVRALLFRVEPLDPVTLVTTAVLISLIAAAVSLRPAIAAGRVDLVSVLRDN